MKVENKRIIFVFLFFLSINVAYCQNIAGSNIPFSRIEWIKDSIGCNSYRYNNYFEVYKYFSRDTSNYTLFEFVGIMGVPNSIYAMNQHFSNEFTSEIESQIVIKLYYLVYCVCDAKGQPVNNDAKKYLEFWFNYDGTWLKVSL